ncbi:MAG: FimB/Mfa2 family fimbrial subunit [Bacteroidales bacterium]|nr:FimB/Mfa2 family fimbrial subunit [Bacteroidales bacterium]
MKKNRLYSYVSSVFAGAVALMMAMAASSCNDLIYEDLDDCDRGLKVRFVYDYNMEFANAFPAQVHCLTLLVYDGAGKYVRTVAATDREQLSDEYWRMTLDLPAGKYQLLAYGGMECADASFRFVTEPGPQVAMTSLKVELEQSQLTSPVGTDLHPLFYGYLGDLTVSQSDTDYREVTVNMMKDTNNLRILLQNISGTPVDEADFRFELTDNENSLFNWDNSLLPVEEFAYMPWAQGNAEYIFTDDEDHVSTAAFAEFSTSRFTTASKTRLTIVRASDNRTILSIPLVQYLLMLKSQHFDYMKSQEFLDRESRWNVIFFLDSDKGGTWVTTHFVVNNWTVRINNISM